MFEILVLYRNPNKDCIFYAKTVEVPQYAIIKMVRSVQATCTGLLPFRAVQALKRGLKILKAGKRLMMNKLGMVSYPLDNVLFHSNQSVWMQHRKNKRN
jgi:hypothetical protein